MSRYRILKIIYLKKNGILKWAIDGFDEWQRNRLSTPQEIQEAVEEYKQESDILADFIGEKCVENANYEVLFKDLYNAYVEWAEENKEKSYRNRLLVAG